MACLRAMVSAFERGPLIPVDMTGEDGNMYPAATRVFLRYSSLLARVLDYGRTEVSDIAHAVRPFIRLNNAYRHLKTGHPSIRMNHIVLKYQLRTPPNSGN